MADSTQPWTFLLFFLLSLQIPLSLASPQNIETYYPSPSPPPPPPPPPNDSPPPIFISPAIQPPQSPPPKPSGNGNKIAKAVAATAASTLVVTALAFLLIQRYMVAKRKREKIDGVAAAAAAGGSGGGGGGRPLPLQSRSTYVRYQGDVKGFIVDENGLDVLYWRKLERRNSNSPRNSHDLRKEVLKNQRGDERRKNEAVQEVPLLRGKSSSSHVKVLPENDDIRDQVNDVIRAYGIRNDSFNSVPRQQQPRKPSAGIVFKPEPDAEPPSSRSSSSSGPPLASAPPTPPPKAPPSPPPPVTPFLSVPKKITAAPPPPPPPIPVNKAPAPPPAPPVPVSKAPAPPPAPPIPVNKAPAPPPAPPPKARSLNAVSKPPPPPPPKGKPVEKSSGEGTSGGDGGQVKLKPLHWDKVNMVNTEHSMVWDKINDGGSFRFDGDLMEALFGYVATNKKSPKGNNNTTTTANNNNQTAEAKSSSSQTFILDTRKSQNIAIVLRSLYVSRKEVIDALMEGIGLSQETLEKLSRVAPTAEEQSQILEYSGDPSRLADAESFLFHILKAVPSAFTRLNAMLFRSSYGSEIAHLKDSLQALELACGELRTRGLFVKLLEAILKAGNRMNAGTSRGNAQAFNLTSLRKLSDVKSTDGKTTLLHFVVEEVVRSEGKRCVLNRNRSLNRSTSTSRSSSSSSSPLKEEREKEYVMLGLPVVGGLSSEFSSVKKAASVDYDAVSSTCSVLSKRAAEIRRLIVSQSVKGGFAKEMESFLDSVEEELRKVDQERARVLEVVSKTTEYYQAGASKDKEAHPFQLFVIVKDFLVMVDKVCVEIARNMQRKRGGNSGLGSSPKAPPPRPEKFAARFPNLPENFMSDKSSGRSSSDESDDE